MTIEATEVEFDPIAALGIAIDAMKARENQHKRHRNYHEGEHPRLNWVEKIRKVFGDSVADQIHQANYCDLAISAPLARMRVTGFDDPTAEELFRKNGLFQTQEDAYLDAMVIDTGYVVVAEADEGSEVPYDIVVQRSEDCYVEPDSLKPHDRRFAVKIEADYDLGEEGGYRAWVWDRTHYWRYTAEVGDPDKVDLPKASAFEPDPEDDHDLHGFDGVPMVEFKRRRDPISHLAKVIPFQDRIDMLEIEKVVAGLFGATRQRVFFTRQELDDGDTEASPDFAIVLDPGDKEDGAPSSVTEFEHTPLENFDGGIDKEIDRLYEVAELPKHGRVNPGATDAGEAIKADEGPHIQMVKGWTRSFDTSWQTVFALLGIETEPVWEDPAPRNEQTNMQTVKLAVDAGMPLETALRRYADFTEDDLIEFRRDKLKVEAEAEKARQAALDAEEAGRETSEVVESRFDA